MENDNTAQPLTCANCGEVSTNPGQFIDDGRWLCTAACKMELLSGGAKSETFPSGYYFRDDSDGGRLIKKDAKQPHIVDILTALIDERGAIVTSADCSPMELAFARKEGRFYVDADGFGFVLRMKAWRENAEHATEKQC